MRIESVNKDNSHSWVRISHDLNKLVTDSSNKDQDNNEEETSEIQFEDFALKTNVLAFASRSKAKAKPRRRTPACSSTRTIPISERSCTDIEPEEYSPIAYPVSRTTEYSSSSWSSTSRRRWSDRTLEIKGLVFRTILHNLNSGLMKSGRVQWRKAEETRKGFQYCTDPSGQEILYLRALPGHSGRNLVDPELQDNVLIPNDFFEYIDYIECAINLHSITNSELIPGGQNFREKTDDIHHVFGSY